MIVSELEMDLSSDKQTNRNAIDLSSKDGIELVSNETPVMETQDISDIRKEVIIKETPKVEEVLPTQPVKEDVKPEEPEVMEVKIDPNMEMLNNAYRDYYDVVNKLPANLLDNLNSSYMVLERSISAIPKDILFKFTSSFENIDEDIPKIFLNPNDFGSSNYSFIIEKLKIYYEFIATVPSQMVTNLFVAYQEYSNYYKMIPSDIFEYLVSTYREYKRCLSYVSPELITSMGYDKIDSIFLNRVLLHEENMNFLLQDIDQKERVSNVRYGITNDINVVDGHFIVIPLFSRDDYINITSQTGSIDRANEICSYNMKVIYDSVERVGKTLNQDIAILDNIKANMEISTMFIGLSKNNKETILSIINDQVNRRKAFISTVSEDLKSGWNRIEGQLGLDIDDEEDYFNKLDKISKCANGYQNLFADLMSIQQIINLIKQNGYTIK